MKLPLQILRLQARAWRDYGIALPQFLRLTPSELRVLTRDAHSEREAEARMADRRTARLCAAVYNNNPRRKKGAQPLSEDDFMPKRRAVGREPQSSAVIRSKMQALAMVLNMN